MTATQLQPEPGPAAELPVLPEMTTLQCGCPGEFTRLNSITVLLNCAGCGQPQIQIEGCPAHLAEIIQALIDGD